MSERHVGDVSLEVPDIPEAVNKKIEIKIGTILRLIFLIAVYLNQVCETMGAYDLFIPQKYRSVVSVLSLVATAAASIAAYWFNNSWTPEATVVDKLLATIKHTSTYCPEIVDAVDKSIAEFNKDQAEAASKMKIPSSDKLENS